MGVVVRQFLHIAMVPTYAFLPIYEPCIFASIKMHVTLLYFWAGLT